MLQSLMADHYLPKILPDMECIPILPRLYSIWEWVETQRYTHIYIYMYTLYIPYLGDEILLLLWCLAECQVIQHFDPCIPGPRKWKDLTGRI